MSDTLKKFVAPVRYLRRYNNPFWKWVDKIEKAHIWTLTTDLYGVSDHDNLHSMISMCKKITLSSCGIVSEKFHQQFTKWEQELDRIQLTPDTLKLHKTINMDILGSRLFKLKKMSSHVENISSPIEYVAEEPVVPSSADFSITYRNENYQKLIAIRKKKLIKSNSADRLSIHSIMGKRDTLIEDSTPLESNPDGHLFQVPPNIEVPISYSRMHSNEVHKYMNFPPISRETSQIDAEFKSSIFAAQLTDLSFPYKGDPLETILGASKELVLAKLSLYPEAWLVKHFFVSTWEMFNFSEDTIGNFVIAPNFLKGEDEFPSLDLFLWSGEPDSPTFYAFPILRNQNGFSVNESETAFTSLASLVAHYSFNLTEDLPVLLKHPFLTELMPTLKRPQNLSLQESYLIHTLECSTANWLTSDAVNDKNFSNAPPGAFKVQENLSSGSVKLFANVGTQTEPKIEFYEINAYEDGFGFSKSEKRFPTLATLISHYICWYADIQCQLNYSYSPKEGSDSINRMLAITNMVNEVYIARALALNPQSWYHQGTDPNDHILRRRLQDQPIGNFVVAEYKNTFVLLVHQGEQGARIISFQIEKVNLSYMIEGVDTSFPSLPLLMGYLCCNRSDLLTFLLSIPNIVSESSHNILSRKYSQANELTQKDFDPENIGRRSMKLSKFHQESASRCLSNPNMKLFGQINQFCTALNDNPNVWRFYEIPKAMKHIKQLKYRSFVVTPSPPPGQHILFVRTGEHDAEAVELYTIYESEKGNCGLERDNFPYSSLVMLLAQGCCVKIDGLPFVLNCFN